jgi:hypothetical protein
MRAGIDQRPTRSAQNFQRRMRVVTGCRGFLLGLRTGGSCPVRIHAGPGTDRRPPGSSERLELHGERPAAGSGKLAVRCSGLAEAAVGDQPWLMLRSSRLLAACAFLVGILLGASVCGAGL